MYVGVFNSTIAAFPVNAKGKDVTPDLVIGGSNTGLNDPRSLAVDANYNVYAGNYGRGSTAGSITVYGAGASGNVAPLRTIAGEKTRLSIVTGVAVDAEGYIYAVSQCCTSGGIVTVYAPTANGDVAPVRKIFGSDTGLSLPVGVALDSKGRICVLNYGYGLAAPSSITVYDAHARGDAKPIREIVGYDAQLSYVSSIALDKHDNMYVTGYFYPSMSVSVYAAGGDGDVAPVRVITGLYSAYSSAVDSTDKLHVTDYELGWINEYAADANGGASPLRKVRSKDPSSYDARGIAIR